MSAFLPQRHKRTFQAARFLRCCGVPSMKLGSFKGPCGNLESVFVRLSLTPVRFDCGTASAPKQVGRSNCLATPAALQTWPWLKRNAVALSAVRDDFGRPVVFPARHRTTLAKGEAAHLLKCCAQHFKGHVADVLMLRWLRRFRFDRGFAGFSATFHFGSRPYWMAGLPVLGCTAEFGFLPSVPSCPPCT